MADRISELLKAIDDIDLTTNEAVSNVRNANNRLVSKYQLFDESSKTDSSEYYGTEVVQEANALATGLLIGGGVIALLAGCFVAIRKILNNRKTVALKKDDGSKINITTPKWDNPSEVQKYLKSITELYQSSNKDYAQIPKVYHTDTMSQVLELIDKAMDSVNSQITQYAADNNYIIKPDNALLDALKALQIANTQESFAAAITENATSTIYFESNDPNVESWTGTVMPSIESINSIYTKISKKIDALSKQCEQLKKTANDLAAADQNSVIKTENSQYMNEFNMFTMRVTIATQTIIAMLDDCTLNIANYLIRNKAPQASSDSKVDLTRASNDKNDKAAGNTTTATPTPEAKPITNPTPDNTQPQNVSAPVNTPVPTPTSEPTQSTVVNTPTPTGPERPETITGTDGTKYLNNMPTGVNSQRKPALEETLAANQNNVPVTPKDVEFPEPGQGPANSNITPIGENPPVQPRQAVQNNPVVQPQQTTPNNPPVEKQPEPQPEPVQQPPQPKSQGEEYFDNMPESITFKDSPMVISKNKLDNDTKTLIIDYINKNGVDNFNEIIDTLSSETSFVVKEYEDMMKDQNVDQDALGEYFKNNMETVIANLCDDYKNEYDMIFGIARASTVMSGNEILPVLPSSAKSPSSLGHGESVIPLEYDKNGNLVTCDLLGYNMDTMRLILDKLPYDIFNKGDMTSFDTWDAFVKNISQTKWDHRSAAILVKILRSFTIDTHSTDPNNALNGVNPFANVASDAEGHVIPKMKKSFIEKLQSNTKQQPVDQGTINDQADGSVVPEYDPMSSDNTQANSSATPGYEIPEEDNLVNRTNLTSAEQRLLNVLHISDVKSLESLDAKEQNQVLQGAEAAVFLDNSLRGEGQSQTFDDVIRNTLEYYFMYRWNENDMYMPANDRFNMLFPHKTQQANPALKNKTYRELINRILIANDVMKLKYPGAPIIEYNIDEIEPIC